MLWQKLKLLEDKQGSPYLVVQLQVGNRFAESQTLISHVRNTSMVGLTNSVQNERYVSGIFENEEKNDEE